MDQLQDGAAVQTTGKRTNRFIVRTQVSHFGTFGVSQEPPSVQALQLQDKTITAKPVSDADQSDWRTRWPPAANWLIQQNAPVLFANREKLHRVPFRASLAPSCKGIRRR